MPTVATTTAGRVRGRASEAYGRPLVSFRGIPFAAPPVGPLRFAPPAPPAAWAGERDATRFGPAPPQTGGALLELLGTAVRGEQGEGCLGLNVVTPALDGARRPVMVWIHGGAFISGTSGVPVYAGEPLAARGDVVVVTFDYRVGALGFLHLDGSEGAGGPRCTNLGLLDQVAALRWVRDNIAAFGGDPDRVLVFGESAGAGSIGALLAMPAARGLFHAAILQSGAPDGYLTPDEARERTERLLAVLGAGPAELMELPVSALLAAQQKCAGERMWKTGMLFTPVVDGDTMPERPMAAVRDGRASAVPLVIGTTRDELQLYKYGGRTPELDDRAVAHALAGHLPGEAPGGGALGERVLEAYRRARASRGESLAGIDLVYAVQTDLAMRGPAIRMAEHQAARGGDVWMYLFDWCSPVEGGALGACHALDVPFVLGALDAPGMAALVGDGPDARRVSAEMMDAWIAFARHGRLATTALGDWPPYAPAERATMRFGRSSGLVLAPREEERVALEGIVASQVP